MEVPINYVAVLVAAIAMMALGMLWYGPLFGKQWLALSGHEMGKGKPMGLSMALMVVSTLVMAYAFAHFIIFGNTYLNMGGITAGLMAGFWSWLGFIAPVTLGVVLWEGKPWKLWFINSFYYLVGLLLMGMILSSWM